MPSQPSGFDFGGISRAAKPGEDAGGFDFSGLASVPEPPAETRSGFAKVWDTVTTPLVREDTARRVSARIAGRESLPTLAGGVVEAVKGIPDVLRGVVRHPVETLRGLTGGLVEGAAQLTSPLDLALTATVPPARGARAVFTPAVQAIRDLEGAIVAARGARRMDDVARLTRELASARQSAGRADAVTGAVRGAELGASAGSVVRGVERAAQGDQEGDVPAGMAQAAFGLLGLKTATPRLPSPVVRVVRGELPGHVRPSFVGMPDGREGRPEDIPLTAAEDGSYVRAEPAEYARREVRGLLPSGPRFVAAQDGVVAPLEQAHALADGAPRRPVPTESRVDVTRAAIADRQFDGAAVTRKIYSSDPAATDAPKVQLSDPQRVELQRMFAELESLPYTDRTYTYLPHARRGQDEIWTAGGAGAPVFHGITQGQSGVTRSDAMHAIRRMLNGEHSALGQRALDEANRYLAGGGTRRMLPDDAGVRNAPQSGEMRDDDFEAFGQTLDDLAALGPSGEPGEAGAINPALLMHLGGAVTGAVTGGTLGDDAESRIRGAVVGGVTGALLPSTLGPRGSARILNGRLSRADGEAPRSVVGLHRVSGDGVTIPVTSRPAARPNQPLQDPLRGVDVFLSKMPEEVRGGIRQVLEDNGGFQAQRRGAINQEAADTLAQGVLVNLQRRVKPGTALNVEAIRAHTDALATAQGKVNDLSQRIARGQNTDADVLALEASKAEVSTIAASIMGARSEAGRALAQFRTLARVLETGNPRLIQEAAESLRGDAAEFASQFAQLPDDPMARFQWLQQRNRPSVREQARQYYYANILSGLKTHERNTIGNAANVLTNLMTHPATVAVDAVRSRATGAPRQAYLGELPHQTVGAFIGLQQGFREALFSLRNGVNRSALTQSLSAAEAGKLDVPRVEFGGGGANPFNWPGRALDAADQFFRSIAKNQEAYGLAFALAKREGRTGAALIDRMAELRAGAGDDGTRILEQADTFARRSVFQEKAGPVVGKLQALMKDVPELSFVMPFVRTPANILRQGGEFSPLGFGMKAARQEGRAGEQAQARAALGSVALGGLAYLLATQQIEVSGSGPSNPSDRAQLMEQGWRPNSVRVGHQWVEYSLLQPISVPLMVMANAFETWRASDAKDDDTASKIAATALKSLRSVLDLSFLSGISDLFNAIEESGVSLEGASRIGGRVAQGFVPFVGAQRTVTQALDPTVRRPHGVVESLQASMPGLSSSLEPRLDRFGNQVTRPGRAVRRAADPFNVTPTVDDPVLAELGRVGVRMGPQTARMSLPAGVTVSRAQDFDIRKLKGTTTYSVLTRLVASEGYQRLADEQKADALERAIEQTRGAVTQRVKQALRVQRVR